MSKKPTYPTRFVSYQPGETCEPWRDIIVTLEEVAAHTVTLTVDTRNHDLPGYGLTQSLIAFPNLTHAECVEEAVDDCARAIRDELPIWLEEKRACVRGARQWRRLHRLRERVLTGDAPW